MYVYTLTETDTHTHTTEYDRYMIYILLYTIVGWCACFFWPFFTFLFVDASTPGYHTPVSHWFCTSEIWNRHCKVWNLTETTVLSKPTFFVCSFLGTSHDHESGTYENIILEVFFFHLHDCLRKRATLPNKTLLPSSKTALAGWKSIPFQSAMSQSKYWRILLDVSHEHYGKFPGWDIFSSNFT